MNLDPLGLSAASAQCEPRTSRDLRDRSNKRGAADKAEADNLLAPPTRAANTVNRALNALYLIYSSFTYLCLFSHTLYPPSLVPLCPLSSPPPPPQAPPKSEGSFIFLFFSFLTSSSFSLLIGDRADEPWAAANRKWSSSAFLSAPPPPDTRTHAMSAPPPFRDPPISRHAVIY